MVYTVQKLATLAGTSVRTLHYYDEIGLLSPSRRRENGYREYGELELLKLQQILFFRELDFSVLEIKKIMQNPRFDMRRALANHRTMIELKKKRLSELLRTIDKTIKKLDKETTMDDSELYDAFSDKEMREYAEEAKKLWGDTEAYKQSIERTKHWTKADAQRLKKEGEEFTKLLAQTMNKGPLSPAFQTLIAQHYESLRMFYDPNPTMYRGLADMYVTDTRFTAYYDHFARGLAKTMREAMHFYADTLEHRS